MLNFLKSKMTEKILTNGPDIATKLMDLAVKAHPLAQNAIRDIMEQQLFPWYEANTGTKFATKEVRQAVADRINLALADVRFKHKDDERVDPVKYLVSTVVPAYKGNAEYDLLLVMAPINHEGQNIKVTLGALLCNFIPIEQVQFQRYDS